MEMLSWCFMFYVDKKRASPGNLLSYTGKGDLFVFTLVNEAHVTGILNVTMGYLDFFAVFLDVV